MGDDTGGGSATPDIASCVYHSKIRGYHIYKEIWTAAIGEPLSCRREIGNLMDPYAVAVVKAGVVVGHIPRTISTLCSLFLARGGNITCEVTGNRQYSRDLPQGGLELPCKLTFSNSSKEIAKVKRLLQSAPCTMKTCSVMTLSNFTTITQSVTPSVTQSVTQSQWRI